MKNKQIVGERHAKAREPVGRQHAEEDRQNGRAEADDQRIHEALDEPCDGPAITMLRDRGRSCRTMSWAAAAGDEIVRLTGLHGEEIDIAFERRL